MKKIVILLIFITSIFATLCAQTDSIAQKMGADSVKKVAKKTVKSPAKTATKNSSKSIVKVSTKPEPVAIPFSFLENYFIKNNFVMKTDVEVREFRSMADFNSVLGVAQTMDKPVYKPDFSKGFVIGILSKASENPTEGTLSSLTRLGNTIFLQINTHKRTEKSTMAYAPLQLLYIPIANSETIIVKTGVNGSTPQ